jgi:hypothetical protein
MWLNAIFSGEESGICVQFGASISFGVLKLELF